MIDKLIGKALDKAVPYTWHNLDHVEVEKVMQAVAKLVAQECIQVVAREANTYEQPTWAFEIVNDIADTFEVPYEQILNNLLEILLRNPSRGGNH